MKYKQELEFSIGIVQEAGRIMSKYFGIATDTNWKDDETPLTKADTAINELLIEKTQKEFPGDGVLGEEQSFSLESERIWVFDPIDGTMAYSSGVPTSTSALALVVDGRPVVAAVYDLATGRTYHAARGSGACVDGEAVRVNDQEIFDAKMFINVDGRNFLEEHSNVEIIAKLTKQNVRVTKSFSIVFNAMPLVYGKTAASIGVIEYPWDGAALALLVEEAGGKVTDLNGDERRWDKKGAGVVASNGVIHDKIIQLIKAAKDESTGD